MLATVRTEAAATPLRALGVTVHVAAVLVSFSPGRAHRRGPGRCRRDGPGGGNLRPQALGLPWPASVPVADVPETLQHDRSALNARVKRDLGLTLRYPIWREGFTQCLAAEGVAFQA